MKELTPAELIAHLDASLKSKFEGEEFLPAELSRVLAGIVACVRRSVLRSAQQEESSPGPIDVLVTLDHFCTPWMGRGEIVDRIENTCGLDQEMSWYALEAVEQKIDAALSAAPSVEVKNLGVIEGSELPSYKIHLAEHLKFKPAERKDLSAASYATPRAKVTTG